MLAASSAALADGTIYLETGVNYSQANPYQYGNGGEFTALVTNFDTTALAATGSNIPLYPSTPGGYNVPTGYSDVSTANASATHTPAGSA